jgi:hypothetical protein
MVVVESSRMEFPSKHDRKTDANDRIRRRKHREPFLLHNRVNEDGYEGIVWSVVGMDRW